MPVAPFILGADPWPDRGEPKAGNPAPIAAPRPARGFEALRALHHQLAQEAALGRSLTRLAIIGNMTLAQARALTASPAFRELVAHYRQAA